MTSNSTKYPYCRRRYQQAAAYKKHLQTIHLDIVLSLRVRATADLGSRLATAFRQHENIDPDDSDNEFDPELEIEDQGAYNEVENDTQDNSDAEHASELPAPGHPSSQEIIPGAGRPLGNDVNYTEHNLATTNHL